MPTGAQPGIGMSCLQITGSGRASLSCLRRRNRHLWCVSLVFERGGEVGDDVVGRFYADRKADEAVADAHPLALLRSDIAMRRHRGIQHHRMYVAEGSAANDQLQPVHEREYVI